MFVNFKIPIIVRIKIRISIKIFEISALNNNFNLKLYVKPIHSNFKMDYCERIIPHAVHL